MASKNRFAAAAILILLLAVAAAALYNQTSTNLLHTSRIACVGDSITEISTYPSDLQALVGSASEVSNFGVSGSTVSKTSDRPYMSCSAFESAKNFQPTVVIILLGANDARKDNYPYIADFTGDYKQLIEQFQSLQSKPEIFLVLPPPIFNNTLGLSSDNYTLGIIPKILQVANETGLPLIDVYTPILGHPEYFVDGVHPNDAGAQIIANIIYSQLGNATG